MKKILWTVLYFILLIEIYSILPKKSNVVELSKDPLFVIGALNVQSHFSRGSGSAETIAQEAEKAGLNFVIVTDNDKNEIKRKNLDKPYGDVDLYSEIKVTTPSGKAIPFYSDGNLRNASDNEIKKATWNHFQGLEKSDLFVVVAHPSHPQHPWTQFDRFPEGIEVVNLDSVYQRTLSYSPFSFFLSVSTFPLNPFLSSNRFYEVNPKDMSAWDNMNQLSPGHFGILGHDVHAKIKGIGPFAVPWPSYEMVFRMASNVVLLKDPLPKNYSERRKVIYEHIRQGRLAILYRPLSEFPGNDWRLKCDNKTYRSGDVILTNTNHCFFEMKTPDHFPYERRFEIWHDGKAYFSSSDRGLVTAPLNGTGFYRLMVWVNPKTVTGLLFDKPIPYLIYNPIYLR